MYGALDVPLTITRSCKGSEDLRIEQINVRAKVTQPDPAIFDSGNNLYIPELPPRSLNEIIAKFEQERYRPAPKPKLIYTR